MADIQYLNYGDLQIELLALLNNLANNVQDYVAKQPWSKKRKDKFMSAYSDLMNQGILGASNSTGQWVIDVNGNIDLDSKDKKDKEMYGEAAYFIQQQMAGLPTKSSLEEKKEDKSKLPVFDNAYFTKNFQAHIGNNMFGGRNWTTNEWNELDSRGDDGLRGTNERAKTLAKYLRSYSDSLLEGQHNFEGSPFNNLDDFKTRINTAITELENGTWNLADKDSLNRIGLNPADYFNNGSGDLSGLKNKEGLELTYAELALYNLEQAKIKAKENAEKAKVAKKAAYDNTLFITRGSSKLQGRNALELKTKYGGDDNKLKQALVLYSQLDIRTLSPDELSEIHGAYRYLAKSPIDSNLLKKLLSSSSGLYRNAAPNRFKKIDGVDNLIWDSAAGQVIQIQNRQQYNNLNQSLNLFNNVKTPQDKERDYLNSKIPGITNAEWKELSAIGLDIASIINPEAVTGSAMALGAAGLRHSAKNDSNPDWSAGDYFWLGVDYLTGALGGIQVLGDAVLGVKTMTTASKAIPILRKISRLGAWNDLVGLIPDLAEATRKITSGEELTVKDWRAIGLGIRGLVSHGRLNRQNLGERKVIQESGYSPEQASSIKGKVRDWTNKTGFTRTKVSENSSTPTVKVKLNGNEKEVEIPISQKVKTKIEEEVRKAGNDSAKRNEAIEKVLKDKELMGDQAIAESNKISVTEPTRMDNKFIPLILGTTNQLFGTKIEQSGRGNDNFENWLNNRNYLDRLKYGSDRELIATRNRLGIKNLSQESVSSLEPTTSLESITSLKPVSSLSSYFPKDENETIIKTINNAINPPQNKLTRQSRWITPKNSLVDGKLIDGNKYQVLFGKSSSGLDEMLVIFNGNSTKLSGKTLNEQKQSLGKWIQEQNNKISQLGNLSINRNDENWKNFVKSILELKRKGYLFKQGGKITDLQIDNFLKLYK